MASIVPNVRFVRCPRCQKLLAEYADVPVYRCGVCNTTLQAKHARVGGGAPASIPSQNSVSDHGLERGESMSLSKETDHPTTDTNTSSPDDGCHNDTGETLQKNREIGNGNVVPESLFPNRIQDEEGNCLSEKMEKTLNLGQDGSETSRSPDKTEESTESTDHSVVLEEGNADGDLSNGASGTNVRSPSIPSSHAYDGSISSSDDGGENHIRNQYRLLSKRTFRPREFPDSKTSPKNEEGTVHQEQLQERVLPPKLSDNGYGPQMAGSFSSINGIHTHERGTSGTSEDFHSARNSRELEKVVSFKSTAQGERRNDSPSSKFRDIEHGRIELLRKVDELTDQLIRFHDKAREGDRRSRFTGSRQASQLPLFSILETEQELLQHPLAAIGPRRNPTVPQKYQLPQIPVPPKSNHCCLHCHVPTGTCCSNGCRTCCHICCHPSNSTGFQCHMVSNPPLCYHNTTQKKQDHEVEKLHSQGPKRHCRPVLGGSHFITCYECFQLLQMPEDFHFSTRRYNKLRCGSCSKILMFLLLNRTHIVPHHFKKQLSNEEASSSNSVPHDHGFAQGRTFSYYEENGPSLARSYSTEGEEHVLHVSRNSDYSTEERDDRQPPLHRLMGYYSASEIIYQPWDTDHEA